MAKSVLPTDQYHIEKCAQFCTEVEALIDKSNLQADKKESTTGRKALRLTYIEAVLAVAENLRIEPDLAGAYINPKIKEQLQIEAENRRMIPRSSHLPF